MTTSPAFQFYAHDFLAGRVATYSLEEIGAYSMLLAFDWTLTGLPVEPEKLARLLRVSRRKFDAIWGAIEEQFPEREGRRYNPRLEIERKKQAEWREKSAKGGRAHGTKGGSRVVEPNPQPFANTPTPSPTPTPVTTRSTDMPPKPAAVRVVPPDDPRFAATWAKYPRRAGGNSRADAFKQWRARVTAGVDPEVMDAGTVRYEAYCRAQGWIGTEYVKQGATFYGSGAHWLEPWDTAPPRASTAVAQLVRVDAAEAAWEALLAMVPAWHRREITPAVHQALPAGTRRGISKIGGFKVLSETRAEQLTWVKKEFLAAFRASPATVPA